MPKIIQFVVNKNSWEYKVNRASTVLSLKKNRRTGGHKVELAKEQCRLDIRKCSFSKRTMDDWNI